MPDAPWKDCTLDDLVNTNPEALGGSTPPRSRFRYIDINSVTLGKIDWQSVPEVEFRSAPSRARRIVRPGDTMFCTVRPSLQAHAYADWNEPEGFICSTGFAVLHPKQADKRFIFHTVFSEAVASHVRQREVGSSYPAVNESDLKQTPLRVPELEVEQSRIAEILDTLDAAIREAEAVVAKLKQVKAGLLHDLLTCGLDEHGQLRVEDRQQHYVSFTELALINPPLSVPIPQPQTRVSFIAMQDVSNSGVWENRQTRKMSEINSGYTPFQEGDVLFAKITPCMENGKGCHATGLTNGIGFGSTEFHVLRARGKNCARFIYYWTRYEHLRVKAAAQMTGSAGQQRVEATFFDRFSVPQFRPEEQTQIAEFLDIADTRIYREEENLLKLQSLKRGLAHDLLTGRVRVKVGGAA